MMSDQMRSVWGGKVDDFNNLFILGGRGPSHTETLSLFYWRAFFPHSGGSFQYHASNWGITQNGLENETTYFSLPFFEHSDSSE